MTSILDYLNPFSDNFIGKKIIELLGNLLRTLFIPSNDYFQNKFEEVKYKLSLKLSFDSYIDLLENIYNLATDQMITIDIEGYEVGGETYSANDFIDFSIINDLKPTYFGFIRGFVYIFLVFFALNSIYRLIRGGNVTNDGSGGK